jgi:hypothetical protein
MFEDRTYLIVPTTEILKIDFSQVLQESADNVRKSIGETKFIIKWEGETPDFIDDLLDVEGPCTYEEILEIVQSVEWLGQMEVI